MYLIIFFVLSRRILISYVFYNCLNFVKTRYHHITIYVIEYDTHIFSCRVFFSSKYLSCFFFNLFFEGYPPPCPTVFLSYFLVENFIHFKMFALFVFCSFYDGYSSPFLVIKVNLRKPVL
jgi:hypothetical protein